MLSRPGTFLVPAALAVLIAISGCSGGEDTTTGGTTSKAGGTVGSSDTKKSDTSAGSTTAVIAQQTFPAMAGPMDAQGGTVTTTLGNLEVSGKTMTLHWAIRWDNPDKANDAATSMFKLGGTKNIPMLTDTVNLKQYRPLCTKGSWQGADAADSIYCENSVLVSPKDVTLKFSNHSTAEAWAVFAAPQDKEAKVDVSVVDGWPAFSAVTPTEAK